MKTTALLLLSLAAVTARAEESKPLLAVPGKVILEAKLDGAPGAPWKAAKGKWEAAEGAMSGSELVEDKHGAVLRIPNKMQDFTIEYEFKFDGARSTSLSINAVKDHMARINITPKSVTIQRDDNDHEGPDKAVVFARFPAELGEGWHKVRLDMVGDKMYGQVDDLAAWGANELFKTEKASPGFTVAGQSVCFRNFVLREATLNPGWESIQATLPKPGEKVAPAAAPKGAAKGKGKAKAGAKKKAE
ncbi:MAG: hypothetical protein IAE77_23925 [Prosthecobacter sp.]|jgi:hypothetical protein|uniref:hypothetical protein n=1 Tax=Prosthecobacter sp. TaxID=1965333 RepID=UPI0019F3FE03|nr:hypothetical protein [Prosthecobacter sp.]MBE2286527.1 hypothetical protein [Prosthecobacter sp.]